MDDDGDAEDDLVDVWPCDRRVDEDRRRRVEPLRRLLRRRGSLRVHRLGAATTRWGLLRHRAARREDGATAGAGDVELLRGLQQALPVPDHCDTSLLQSLIREEWKLGDLQDAGARKGRGVLGEVDLREPVFYRVHGGREDHRHTSAKAEASARRCLRTYAGSGEKRQKSRISNFLGRVKTDGQL